MNGLYKRVLKGAYPPIDHRYSSDIKTVIARLLQTDSKERPSCAQILDLDIVKTKCRELGITLDGGEERGESAGALRE